MRLISLAFAVLTASAASAQVTEGYYRVQNVYSERYLYVMDNKGKIDYAATTIEAGAIVPKKYLEKAVYDPASVIYIQTYSNGYTFNAQGTSTRSIIDMPIQLTKRTNGYWCWASKSGMTKYLADVELDLDNEVGAVDTWGTNFHNTDIRLWNILPIDAETDNYFGIKPTVEVGGKYYAPFYASFPIALRSDDMKVYTVTKLNDTKAVLTELTSGGVPANTPVLIECPSNEPTGNRVDLKDGSYGSVTGSMLKGNFFRYGENMPDKYSHKNVTAYNTETQRVFGVTSDGKLGLVTPTETYIPANMAYFESTTGSLPAEIELVLEESGIINAVADGSVSDGNVYNLSGMRVGKVGDNLPKGIYITNGKKVIIK